MSDHAKSLADLGKKLAEARQHERAASATLRAAVVQAVSNGMSESAAAAAAGINRGTVRAFLGKPPTRRKRRKRP